MGKLLIFLHAGCSSGGASQSFLDLLPILTKKYSVFVVAPNLQDSYKEKCVAAGVKIDNFYSRSHGFPCYVAINMLFSLRNIAKRIIYHSRIKKEIQAIHNYFNCDFDLIYSNSLGVQIGCEYAKYYNIPHIWHVREFMNEDHGIEFLMRKRTYNKLFTYSNAIFITRAINDKFNKYFKGQITILHNYVKFDFVDKAYNNTFTFAIIGSISESKGQRYAIEAFFMLQKQYPNCRLLIVGEGYDCEYCKSLVEKYALSDKVLFLGQRNDVNKILSHVNVQLVCSRFEAMGRVTVEGMLSKTLVIGADTAGTKELIGDSHGLQYKQGDTQDLCEKMIYSIEHKAECEKIVEDAYKYAIKEFSYENYEEKLIIFFESVLNK